MDSKPLCPCFFSVPLHYNPASPGEPGLPVAPEILTEIFQALDRQFGGFTHCGVRWGSWQGQEEASIWLCVAVPEEDVLRLRAVVIEIGRTLGQKAMYFEKGMPTAEIIIVSFDPEEEQAAADTHHETDSSEENG